jgi:hypothetical protein
MREDHLQDEHLQPVERRIRRRDSLRYSLAAAEVVWAG